ncbi:MAG: recombinase family protein [Lawsonibacter sp.]
MDIQSRPAYSHQRGLYRRSGARQARHSQLQSPRCEKQDESEWVKVENTHEALVSYEDFMAVKS